MLSEARQRKLDPILTRLRAIPYVREVSQDDFDSTAVNVFISFQAEQIGRDLFKLPFKISAMKAKVRAAWQADAMGGFLHWPVMKYHTLPKVPGIPAERVPEGHDCCYFKIEIYV